MQSLNGCRRIGWAFVKDALPAKFLSAWVGCNYLQIAVATNYIFILQFPTKRACKKQFFGQRGFPAAGGPIQQDDLFPGRNTAAQFA